jgi:hypothetical protein
MVFFLSFLLAVIGKRYHAFFSVTLFFTYNLAP